jgi:hypothetical protein
MTSTSELNLSALWDLPSEQPDSASVRRVAAGSYVSTAASYSPRFEYRRRPRARHRSAPRTIRHHRIHHPLRGNWHLHLAVMLARHQPPTHRFP